MYIVLLSHYNQYNSKWHFCVGLQRAFKKLGIKTKHIRLVGGDFSSYQLQDLQINKPDLFCSFNELAPVLNGQYFFDLLHVPMLHLLVDQALYFTQLTKSLNSYFTAVDLEDVQLMNILSNQRCFFLPHAIDDSWSSSSAQKDLGMVFFGSSVDPDCIESLWKRDAKKVYHALMAAKEYLLSNSNVTVFQALQKHLLPPDEMPRTFTTHLRELEWVIRGHHRNRLLNALSTFDLHIFGEKNVLFPGGRGWKELVPNATIHQTISFKAIFKVMQRAKFTINSSPFFPSGSHERIFMAMQAGSIAITNPSTYIQDLLADCCIFYDVNHFEQLREQIIGLLENPLKREEMIQKAQYQVIKHHTWTQRAQTILDRLGQIVKHG